MARKFNGSCLTLEDEGKREKVEMDCLISTRERKITNQPRVRINKVAQLIEIKAKPIKPNWQNKVKGPNQSKPKTKNL
jgi:hypothetical protein